MSTKGFFLLNNTSQDADALISEYNKNQPFFYSQKRAKWKVLIPLTNKKIVYNQENKKILLSQTISDLWSVWNGL